MKGALTPLPTPCMGCFLLESIVSSDLCPYCNQNCTFLVLAESIISLHITSFLWSIFFVKLSRTLKLILDPPLDKTKGSRSSYCLNIFSKSQQLPNCTGNPSCVYKKRVLVFRTDLQVTEVCSRSFRTIK